MPITTMNHQASPAESHHDDCWTFPKSSPVLSAGRLRRFLLCERLPFMDAFRNPAHSLPLAPWDASQFVVPLYFAEEAFEPVLQDDHESRSRAKLQPRSSPFYSKRDQVEVLPRVLQQFEGGTKQAIAATIDQMQRGVKTISPALLRDGDFWVAPKGLCLTKARPSRFGSYSYQLYFRWNPKDSKRLRAIPVAFAHRVLDAVQGTTTSTIETPSGHFEISDYANATDETVRNLRQVLESRIDPGPHLNGSCGQCVWRKACDADAHRTGHLSLVRGIRRDTAADLSRLGVCTVSDLAEAVPDSIVGSAGIANLENAHRKVMHAQVFRDRSPRIVRPVELPSAAEPEIFIDIETSHDGLGSFVILFCFYVHSARRPLRAPFTAVFVTRRERQDRAWKKFCAELWKFRQTGPFFHYGSLERSVFAKLAAATGSGKWIVDGLVDLYSLTKQSILVPSRSQGLKDVARAINFEWREPETARGDQAAQWWRRWTEEGDATAKRALEVYNQDDLYALAHTLQWVRKTQRSLATKPQIGDDPPRSRAPNAT